MDFKASLSCQKRGSLFSESYSSASHKSSSHHTLHTIESKRNEEENVTQQMDRVIERGQKRWTEQSPKEDKEGLFHGIAFLSHILLIKSKP